MSHGVGRAAPVSARADLSVSCAARGGFQRFAQEQLERRVSPHVGHGVLDGSTAARASVDRKPRFCSADCTSARDVAAPSGVGAAPSGVSGAVVV